MSGAVVIADLDISKLLKPIIDRLRRLEEVDVGCELLRINLGFKVALLSCTLTDLLVQLFRDFDKSLSIGLPIPFQFPQLSP